MANNPFRVYHFSLPSVTNDGLGDYVAQLNVFEELMLDEAGGYTKLGSRRGAWKDDNGKVFNDYMQWYEVATDPITKNSLVRHAQRLFPDQKAFYVAEAGTAEIITKPEPVVPGFVGVEEYKKALDEVLGPVPADRIVPRYKSCGRPGCSVCDAKEFV